MQEEETGQTQVENLPTMKKGEKGWIMPGATSPIWVIYFHREVFFYGKKSCEFLEYLYVFKIKS